MTPPSEYTQDAKLAAIAAHFDLGKVQTYQRTPGTNQNYLVTTDRGDYLFKIIVNTTLEDVLNGLPFLQRLAEFGFAATAYYLKAPNGQSFYQGPDCDAVVLYRLHLVPCNNLPEKRHWIDAHYLPEVIERAVKIYGTERLSETLKAFHALEDFQPATFPQAIVHGDLDCSNCLFEGERLVAFVDWQEIGVGAALMDFVSTVLGFCFIERWADSNYLRTDYFPEFYSALYEGYSSVRPFSAYEKAHLNDALKYVGLTQPVWSMLMWEQYHLGQEMIETNTLYWRFGLDKLTLPVF